METDKKPIDYVHKTKNGGRYDKRLILKIVKEVEAGLPRIEATRKYNLSHGIIHIWMNKHGSPETLSNKRKRYTKLQRRTVVIAVKQGRMSVEEAKIAYNIHSTDLIRTWIYRQKNDFYIPNTLEMTNKSKKVSGFNPTVLAESKLKIEALNTMIDIAEQEFKIKIRKKSGAKQSKK